MADRILTWFTKKYEGTGFAVQPAYYLDTDYEPVAVRIYAEKAPDAGDAEFDIFLDGVSIFNDRDIDLVNWTTGVTTRHTPATHVVLEMGDTQELDAEDFGTEFLGQGSWLTCKMFKDGGGQNFTVQLELAKMAEPDEETTE